MERIAVDGLEIRVYRGGKGSPLMYLHSGFGEIGRLRFFEELEKFGLKVVAPEMPGFGFSTPCREWHKIEDAVYFYRNLMSSLFDSPVPVVGQSLGGWLAAELAVWFPERLSALILIDSVGLHIDGAPIAELFGANPSELMPKVFPSGGNILEHVMPALEGANDSDAVLLHFFRAMETTAYIGWSPYMHDPKLECRLASIPVPTLVLHGSADGVVPLRHAEVFARSIPEAQLEVLEGAGHLPALERPKEVASTIARFLEKAGIHRIAAGANS
jgi:pimeloyl-ACP methyl ester carboxylesterase